MTMLMTDIRKETFADAEQVNAEINSLAQRATDLLGYNALSTRLTQLAIGVELTPLQTVLKALDVEIMRTSDVMTYMREQQIEHTKERLEAWLEEFAKKSMEVGRFSRFDSPAWMREKISEYKQPIPEFVLAKAVQVKAAFPECEVWVEWLSDHPDPFLSIGIPDTKYSWAEPLERYYIEVWAEPKFEGRM